MSWRRHAEYALTDISKVGLHRIDANAAPEIPALFLFWRGPSILQATKRRC
jgi:hypothetical protein